MAEWQRSKSSLVTSLKIYILASVDSPGIHSDVSFQNVMISVRLFSDELLTASNPITSKYLTNSSDVISDMSGMALQSCLFLDSKAVPC